MSTLSDVNARALTLYWYLIHRYSREYTGTESVDVFHESTALITLFVFAVCRGPGRLFLEAVVGAHGRPPRPSHQINDVSLNRKFLLTTDVVHMSSSSPSMSS